MTDDRITLHYAAQSRAFSIRVLLEELGAPYDLHVLNLRRGDQLQPEYLAINPMGKVPAISHRGEVITEQGAILLYLSDLYPEAGLTPGIGDPLRGAFLRWAVFYGASFEPALVDHALKRPPMPRMTAPYADHETVVAVVNRQIEAGPYWLGDRFTTADVLWGSALSWVTAFGIFEKTPAVAAYIDRISSRPAFQRVRAAEQELVAKRDAELAAS